MLKLPQLEFSSKHISIGYMNSAPVGLYERLIISILGLPIGMHTGTVIINNYNTNNKIIITNLMES